MPDQDLLAHISTDDLATVAGVDISTARRWKQSARLPEPVRRLLEVVVLGRLDVLGWRDWRLLQGELIGPDGWRFKPGEVMALPLLRQQLASYQTGERLWKALDPQPEGSSDADEFLRAARSRSP